MVEFLRIPRDVTEATLVRDLAKEWEALTGTLNWQLSGATDAASGYPPYCSEIAGIGNRRPRQARQ